MKQGHNIRNRIRLMSNKRKCAAARSEFRERIMATAETKFAASGFAGARTDPIARRARVNERMIFYRKRRSEAFRRTPPAETAEWS